MFQEVPLGSLAIAIPLAGLADGARRGGKIATEGVAFGRTDSNSPFAERRPLVFSFALRLPLTSTAKALNLPRRKQAGSSGPAIDELLPVFAA